MTSTEQVLQIVAWLLALLEVSAALYILVLNMRHPANRWAGGLLLLFAVNGFAVGQLLGVSDVDNARIPILHLAAAAPAIAPTQLTTMLILFKPEWLRGHGWWLKGLLYILIALPSLLVLSDLFLETQFFYSGIDPSSYAGGYVVLSRYTNGQIGNLIRVFYINVLHALLPLVLLYVSFLDQEISEDGRYLARLLFGMSVVVTAVMFSGRWWNSMVPGLLLGQAIAAMVYTYVGFKQMISERWVRRERLQNRLLILLLAVTVPLIAGIVIFIVMEIDSLFGQILAGQEVSPETAALMVERLKRTIWLVSTGAFVLVMAFVWLSVRQTLRPIQALTETARAIASGDLERKAPVKTRDEIGTLARAFNIMTARLRTLIDELEGRVAERTLALEQRTEQLESALAETNALYTVSRSIIAPTDPTEIFQTIVDTVSEVLPADRVLLITFDEQEERVIDYVSSAEGQVPAVPTTYEELLSGLSGWVLREGKPTLSSKDRSDPRESSSVQERRRTHDCGAIIVVPLQYQDQIFGTLTALNHIDDPNFTERDVDLMVAMANQAATAFHSARLMEQTQISLRETKTLYRLSRSLIEPQHEAALLQKTVNLVVEALSADRVGITMMDIDRHRILRNVVGGPGVEEIHTDVSFEETMEGLSGWAIRERKPALSPKGHSDPCESPRVQERRAETNCGSTLVVPLYYQDKALGALTAINRPDQPDFTPHDAELTMTMANQAAAAIQNAHLFKQTQNALAETHALYRISRRLITSDNLASLLQAVVDGVVRTLPANRAALITIDQSEGKILNLVSRGKGAGHIAEIPYDELMEGLSGWVIRENRPALSPQGTPDPRESERVQQRRAETMCGGILVVPLHYQGETLGTITAINLPDEPDFTQHDADLMMALANQAAAAIQNARLFRQTQEALAQMEVLYRVGRSLIAYEDLHDLLQMVSDAIAETLSATWVTAITFDIDEREVLEIVTGGPDERGPFRLPYEELEAGLTGWVIREQEPALSSGQNPDPRESEIVRQHRMELGIGPIIVTPLRHHDRMLGTLTAMRRQGDVDFTQQDVDLMMAMTNQAAAAVQNARLFEQTQIALTETQALYRASQPLFNYQDLPNLLQSVVDGIAEALPASRVMLLNLDREARTVVDMVVGGENDEEILVTFDELWDGLTGWVLRHERPAFSAKGQRDSRESRYIQEGRKQYGFGSIIVVPLRYRGKIFGTITAMNTIDEPDFSERDVELMTAMANQAAAAIENVRLFEQTQTALAETRALYDVSRSLITFDDPAEALTRTTNAVAEALGADRVVLYTLDFEAERIVHQVKGGPDLTPLLPTTFEELQGGLTGWVLREGRAARSSKRLPDPRESAQVQRQRDQLESGSTMVAPLRYGKKVLGTVSAVNRRDQPDFTENDLQQFTAMANQIASAVDNVRLFAETQKALAKTEALYQVARSVIALEDLDEKLQIVTHQVARSLPADRVLLITLDMDKKRAVHHVTGGTGKKIPRVPYEELMNGLTGWVIRKRKPAISPKGKPDPREGPAARQTRLAAKSGSILVVPLIYEEEILGTLTAVNRPDQRDFSSEDADLMLTMANQAAIAIKNTQLVESLEAQVAARTAEIRAEQEKTEAILESVGDAIVMVDTGLRIRYVNQAFLELTNYRSEEILDQRATVLLEHNLGQLRQLWPSIRHDLVLRKIWRGETTISRAHGSTFEAALTVAAVHDGSGRLIGYVTSHRDITEAKRLEKARRDFLVNVSHQLRTPVTTIQLYLQLLQQNPKAEKVSKYLRNASQETSELAHLIEDMLTVTELDSGSARTVWTEVSLVSIAQDVITKYLPKVEKKQINLDLDLPNYDVPTVYGDPSQLHRAVAELVENAVHFTQDQGRVTVALSVIKKDAQPWVELTVEDNGPGITVEEREHLFERFYRGRLAKSGHIPGSGLGLVIAKSVVKAHGGVLRLLSCDDNGSKFLIRLRAKDEAR